jgi:hypothetical protein
VGRKSFKGIAQRFSCYEWLGSSFYEYLDFKETKEKKVEKTLKALYDKNPHNPWFAALLAHYYFFLGEREYYKGHYGKDNEFYAKCAECCIDAIHRISSSTKYNLRELHQLLFICLEVVQKWDELCFRSEQAFAADPTFANALAMNAKSLFMLGNSSAEKSREAADKLISLFRSSLEFEGLYDANFLLARYYAKIQLDQPKVMKYLRAAVHYAQQGGIDWVYADYDLSKSDFANLQHDPHFKKEISIIKKMWENS